MRGYDRDEYEDLDEYETEGEEEEEVEEEEIEEEDPKPTQEQLEYLELRQRLKESIRKQNGSARAKSQERQRKDNFGSFFGPSQPVIAQRVIQESKSFLENQHLASKIPNPRPAHKKSTNQSTSGSQLRRENPQKVINPLKQKARTLKDTRDYSFLFSDDAELPVNRKLPSHRDVSVSRSDARSTQVSQRSRQSSNNGDRPFPDRSEERRPISNGHEERRPISNGREERRPSANGREDKRPISSGRDDRRPVSSGREERRPVSSGREERRPVSSGREERRPVSSGREERRPVSSGGEERRPVSNGRDERRPVSMNGKMESKALPQKTTSVSRPVSTSMDSRKQVRSSNGSGPGQSVGPKSLSSKMQVGISERNRKVSAPVAKNSMSSMHRPLPSKTPVSKQPLQQKKVLEPNKAKLAQKPMAACSKSQVNKPMRELSSHSSMQDQRPKKKPVRRYSDEEDDDDGDRAISMIRQMFRYNPNKYGNDDDVSDMEANFDDILKEEKRSARIAREEDERELRLIEEEERKERLRKEAKKRKLSQR